MTYPPLRLTLEAEKAKLLALLEQPVQFGRARIVNDLRAVLDKIAALDAGTHWTQPDSDTLEKIVIDNLPKPKEMRMA